MKERERRKRTDALDTPRAMEGKCFRNKILHDAIGFVDALTGARLAH